MTEAIVQLTVEYDDDYSVTKIYEYNQLINPYYNLFKTYKAGVRGSGNQIVSTTYWEGGYTEWEVVESEMNYPLEIDEYYNNNYLATTYYEYVSSIDLTETKPESLNVVAVQYFNIWGQLIPDPDAGLYIKRVIYNDGIKTSTHFK